MIKFIKFRNDLLINKSITDNAKYLYAIVLTHTDKNGYCYFKHETLSSESGYSTKTCSLLLNKLQDAGYLEIKTQYFNGRKSNNSYTLDINILQDCGFTYLNYDILFHKTLDSQDIMQYLKMKRFINNKTFIFINTKAKLLELVNCDKKKFYKCLERLQQFGIIEIQQIDTKCTLTLAYEIERIAKYNIFTDLEIINAWSDLNVEDCAI